jgi:hypothetical protein
VNRFEGLLAEVDSVVGDIDFILRNLKSWMKVRGASLVVLSAGFR